MAASLPRSRGLAAALLGASMLAGCESCSKDRAGEAAPGTESDASADASLTARPRDGGIINESPVPTASVVAMLNPDHLPAYTGPTGSVEGTISVIGDPPRFVAGDFMKCPDAQKIWGHAFREGPKIDHGDARALADAIVVATGYHGFFIPETQEAKEVRIEGCGYTTRTATMTFGQRLEVKNLSKDFWTPVLSPGSTMVLMMATPKGDPAKLYPKKPGHYLLTDRDRSYAVVDVYAFLHPLHTSTDLEGHYRIDGLPIGKVKISTTHPQIDANAEIELDVRAGIVHRVDLVLKNVNRDASAPISIPDADSAPRPILR